MNAVKDYRPGLWAASSPMKQDQSLRGAPELPLDLRDLTICFGSFKAVDRVSLSVAPGAVVGQPLGQHEAAVKPVFLGSGHRPLGQLLHAVEVGGVKGVGEQQAGLGGALGRLRLVRIAKPLQHPPAGAAVAFAVADGRVQRGVAAPAIVVRRVRQPGAVTTLARPPRAASRLAAGVVTVTGVTHALPPPWTVGYTAFGPITARVRIARGSRGCATSAAAPILSIAPTTGPRR